MNLKIGLNKRTCR